MNKEFGMITPFLSQHEGRVNYTTLHPDPKILPRMSRRLIRRTLTGIDGTLYPTLTLSVVMCDESGEPVARFPDEPLSVGVDEVNGETKFFMIATLKTALEEVEKYDIIDDLPIIVEDRV